MLRKTNNTNETSNKLKITRETFNSLVPVSDYTREYYQGSFEHLRKLYLRTNIAGSDPESTKSSTNSSSKCFVSLGSGYGEDALPTLKHFGEDGQYRGLEINKLKVDISQKVFQNFSNIIVHQVDASDLVAVQDLFQPNSVDVVTIRHPGLCALISPTLVKAFEDMITKIIPYLIKEGGVVICTSYTVNENWGFNRLIARCNQGKVENFTQKSDLSRAYEVANPYLSQDSYISYIKSFQHLEPSQIPSRGLFGFLGDYQYRTEMYLKFLSDIFKIFAATSIPMLSLPYVIPLVQNFVSELSGLPDTSPDKSREMGLLRNKNF